MVYSNQQQVFTRELGMELIHLSMWRDYSVVVSTLINTLAPYLLAFSNLLMTFANLVAFTA